MKVLHRKLLRELWHMRWQALAIILVVACGIASYVSIASVDASLRRAQASYYQNYRFAQVFAQLSRAPKSLEKQIAEIPGVAYVQTRVVKDVTIDVRGLPEPATGRLISLPEHGRPVLNDLVLRRGHWMTPGHPNQVIVNEPFAEIHKLTLGEHITAIINGRLQELQIVGIALSPEYVYQISAGSLWPDDKRFGVFWMDEKALATAFDMDGAFNDIALSLAPQASVEDVIDHLDPLLADYGGFAAVGRDKQISHRFISEEFKQLESMSTTLPSIFLGVAAFLLNIVLSRLVMSQREQIAALKALGYTNPAVGGHFIKMMLIIVLLGTVIGILLSLGLGGLMLGVYRQFFRFPQLIFHLQLDVLASAAFISMAAGTIGTLVAVRRAIKLPPAEAMRPPAPTVYRRSVLDLLQVTKLFAQSTRIIIRNLTRRPLRTLMSSAAIALAISILVVGNFSRDALDYVMDVNFQRAERYDVMVNFVHPVEQDVYFELQQLPGVLAVEPHRITPVRLQTEIRTYETAIQGLVPRGHLRRLLTEDLSQASLPSRGLVLTKALGKHLGLRMGDRIEIEVLEEKRPKRTVVITGFIDEMIGYSAYMDIHALHQVLAESPKLSGARLLVDPDQRDTLYHHIKTLPKVAGATLRTSAYDIFNDTTAKMQLVSTGIMALFAAIIAVGVVYNSARVILAERSRELASLRVIGFTRTEVSTILLGELAAQIILAIPIGWAWGYGLAAALIAGLSSEMFRFPLIIQPKTYAFAALVILTSGFITAFVVRRKLDQLDLVAVLKTRE